MALTGFFVCGRFTFMISVIDPATGQYEDIHYRRHPARKTSNAHRYWYRVFLGKRCVGDIMHSGFSGWTAISNHQPNEDLRGPRLMEGFKDRYHAMDYLLHVNGVHEAGPVAKSEVDHQRRMVDIYVTKYYAEKKQHEAIFKLYSEQEKFNSLSRKSLCEQSDRYKAERDAAMAELEALRNA